MSRGTLGAVIAGGASTRFGSAKAFAIVGGHRVIDRVTHALRAAADDVIAIVNDTAIAQSLDLETRADSIPGAGALGGIHAALQWATERGEAGVLAVACDMPFVSIPLLREIVQQAGDDSDAVLPESPGPRGVEPLHAWYSVRCLVAIRAALDRGDQRMIAFHDDVRIQRVGLDRVRTFGDPGILFMNLNTPADRDRAERIHTGGS